MNPLLIGKLTAEQISEIQRKNRDRQAQLSVALEHIMQMALGDTGGSRVCRNFLLSLYNGHAYPFNLNDMRNLDQKLFDACITIMSTDCRPFPPREIHEYWINGNELFDRLKTNRQHYDNG